ncbi:MAG: hypothetical protein Q7R30_13755 [Acidobacteriota bacterium]|nr:hypothetical protein [Acidobacteriota bacterium]
MSKKQDPEFTVVPGVSLDMVLKRLFSVIRGQLLDLRVVDAEKLSASGMRIGIKIPNPVNRCRQSLPSKDQKGLMEFGRECDPRNTAAAAIRTPLNVLVLKVASLLIDLSQIDPAANLWEGRPSYVVDRSRLDAIESVEVGESRLSVGCAARVLLVHLCSIRLECLSFEGWVASRIRVNEHHPSV